MASVAAVGDILGRLHASKSPEYAKVLIERDLAPEVEQLPAEHVLALLLDPGVGLLSFVAATGGGEEAPRGAALKLLRLTVARAAPADVARYSVALRDACAALATADGDNKVKEEALELLAATLANTPPSSSQALRPGELAASLRVWLFRNATPAKAPGGVRAWALRCLGALAEHHAAAVAAHEAAAPPPQVPYGDKPLVLWLREHCLREIQEQLDKAASKKDETKVLTGALDALCAALQAVPPGALQAEQARQALRACLSCVKLVADASRYAPAKAALKLLCRHASAHLAVPLLECVDDALAAVLVCRRHENKDVKDAAKPALDALFDALAVAFADAAQPQATRRSAYDAVWAAAETLMAERDGDSGNGRGSGRGVALALRALGALAPAAAAVGADPAAELARVAGRLSRLAASAEPEDHRGLALGAERALSLLDAHARLAAAASGVGGGADAALADAALGALSAAAEWLAQRFPALAPSTRADFCASAARTLDALARPAAGAPLSRFLARGVPAWLLAALQTQPPADAAPPDQNVPGDVMPAGAPLWPRHEPLWRALLAAPQGGPACFDALAEASLRLFAADLNLRVTRRHVAPVDVDADDDDDGDAAVYGNGALVADEPEDVALFARLAALMAALLPAAPRPALLRWAAPLTRALLSGARASPAIPGFYVLLTALVRACDAAGGLPPHGELAALLRGAVAECAGRARLEQGALRAALLHLVLAAPPDLAPPDLAAPAAGAALRLGVAAPALADAALGALERLQAEAPDALAPHLAAVAPALAPLIEEAARREASRTDEVAEAAAAAAKIAAAAAPKASGARADTAARAARAEKRGAAAARAGLRAEDMVSAAGRAQRLLGLFGAAAHAVVESADASRDGGGDGGAAWDPTPRVGLRLGVAQSPMETFLDGVLPRCAALALSSPDRRSRVAAGEVLHNVTVLLVGRQAQARIAVGSGGASFERVFARLFPAVLALSVDSGEFVAAQLFGPLARQLAQWYGHTGEREGADEAAFLNALAAGVADADNGALRDRCADLLAAVFEWAMRNAAATAGTTLDKLPYIASSVLTRCYAAMAHPSPWRRRGGATVLARLPAFLRGNACRYLVDAHAVDAVRACLECLGRSGADPVGCGADDAARDAALRFMRLLVRRAKSARMQPKLVAFVAQLWRESGRRQLPARSEAQRCFAVLLPHLPNAPTPRDWLLEMRQPHVPAVAVAAQFGAPPPGADADRWFGAAEATLQWTAWALEIGALATGEVVAAAPTPGLEPPVVVACHAVTRVLRPPGHAVSPSALRSSVAVRLLVLLATDMASRSPSAGGITVAVASAHPDALQRILLLALFAPAALGAGVERPQAIEELLKSAARVLACASVQQQHLPACRELLDAFKRAVADLLTARQSSTSGDLPFGLDPAAVDLSVPGAAAALTSMIDGLMELASHAMLLPVLPSAGPMSRAELPRRLVLAVHGLGAKASPAQIQAARRLLKLARVLGGIGGMPLIELLLDETPVDAAASGSGASVSRGELLLLRFQDLLVDAVLYEPAHAVPLLLQPILAGAGQASPAAANAVRTLEAALNAARLSAMLHRDEAAASGGPKLPDLRSNALLSVLAAQLPQLTRLVEADSPAASRAVAINLLARALDLDALCRTAVLLGASSAAKSAIVALHARLLAPMTSAAADAAFPDPSVAAQALEILPAFSELPPDESEPIFAALEKLVFACVPRANGAAELPRGDLRRAPYLKLRTALLAALAALAQRGAAAAAGRLMRCSMNAVFWDAKIPRVIDAMRAVAKACWSCKPGAAHAVADAILAVAMEQLTTEHARVKFPRFAFAAALQPLLSRAPAAYLESFFKRNAVMLVKLASTRPAAPTAAPEDVVLNKRHACFSLMELLYAHCTPASLKLVSAEYERATGGKKMVPLFTKACRTEMQTAEEPAEPLRLACRTAAFAAFATMLAATQTAEPKKGPNDGDLPGPSSLETYTAALLRGDFFAGNSWAAVVDCTKAVTCKLELEARARPLPADAAARQDGSSRAMRLKATVSSTLFSQTMDDAPPPPRRAAIGGAVPMDVDTLSTMTPEDAAASTAVEGADAADDADFEDEAAPEVDMLDRGPALDALVRLLEQCTRAFGPVLTAAVASGALPSWMQPLRDALLKTAPLAPPNAALFVAKALLRLQDRTNEAQRVRAEKAAGDKASETESASMDASMTLAGTTQAPAWDNELLAAAAPQTAAQTRPLARRGRPKTSLPSLFAPQLAAALIAVFVSDPAASGGCAMHDVLRQTCWAVVDWSAAWTDATASDFPDLGAALGRLIDHAAAVTLAGPKEESQKARDANVELVQQLLRSASTAWPAVAQNHPERAPFAEALKVVERKAGGRLPAEVVTRRTVALQLLAGLLLRGQPLVAQTDNADELARRIVTVDIPEPSAGANLYGHKRLYTLAGTVLGLELARRAADGTPPGPWVDKLWEKLRALLASGMPTFYPFVACLATLAERFPAGAVQYAPQVVTRLPDTVTDSRWEALNVLTAACAPGSALDCASLWVDLEPRLGRLAAASSDKESDIKLLGALSALFVNNAWPGAEAAAQGCLPLLKGAFLRHRHGSVRRAYFGLLRSLASAFPAMLQTAHLRESMLGALTDADWTAVQEALEWWDTQAGLRRATLSERLLDMVSTACFAQTADDWPRAAALLLLRLPAHVDGLYDEHLLGDKPLDVSAKFIAAKIDTQWAGASVPVSDGLQSLAAESLSLYPSSMTMASQFGGSQVGPSGALSASQQANPEWLRAAPPPKPLRRVFSGGQPAKPGARGAGVYATDKRDAAILAEAQRAGHEVTLTRQYRQGNFPDITTITRRVLVDALLQVAARDAPAAASALAALAATAWAEKGASAEDTHSKLRNALAASLSEPVAPAPAFFAATARVALADAALPGACGLVQHAKLAQAGLRARQPASAALVAEHALLHYAGARDAAARASKRQRGGDRDVLPGLLDVLAAASTAWAALARLLRSSGESDVALVVMQHTAAASTPECDALRAQLEGDAELARDRFDAAIADAERELGGDEEPEEAEQLRADVARWRDARRELLMSMGRWSDVWEELAETLPAEHGGEGMLPMLWARQEHAAEQVVPAYVRAAVRLGHGDQLRALLAGLAQMADQAPRAAFEAAFGLELAALEATAWPPADDRARLLLAGAARTTRAAWLAAPPSALRIRHALVAGMQPQAELGATVDLVASMRGSPDAAAAPAAAMLARWASHMLSPAFAPPSALETVAAVRELCCDALVSGAAAHGAVAPTAITSLRGELSRAAGDAARHFGALSLSDELLARAPEGFARSKAQLKVCLARVDAASAATLAAEPELREQLLLGPLQALAQPEQELHAPPEAARDVAALRGAFLLRLARLPPTPGEQDCSALYGAQAFAAMQVATVAARPAEAPRSAARDLLRLAALCNEALMLLEDAAEQGAAPASTGELSMAAARAVVAAAGGEEAAAAAMVDAILRAAALASLPDARAALPRALALLGRHGAVRAAFERLAPAVPLWQLLPWAPQMVSLLGGIEADAVLPLLRSLAEAYPRALHFPLALAAASSAGPLQTRAQALLALAVNPAADRFARAVEDLAFPDDRLRRWHAALVIAMRGEASTAPAVRTAVAQMLDDVADPDAARARGAGVLTLDFATSARRKAAEHLGSPVDFAALTPGKLTNFVNAALADPGSQRAKMRKQPRRRVETQSVFLAELREDAADAIEVPGQYAAAEARGEPPRPAEHLRVVGVDPLVTVLESMQAPCKLTLRCSDGTEAEFLAKGGEDLRQDERILRLFRCASAALQAHAPAAARGLSVVTFHVEPLSPRCGLVSWLRGAVPIKDVISRILPATLEADCRNEYANWAVSKVGGEGSKATFSALTMGVKASAEDVMKHLEELQASVPPYTLRTAMLQLAGTPERFLAYRARYAATLAASSAVCFVVGLGDRHTGNIMLDENTGALVHIDFGYSFGTASTLPVPEIVPFRLTRCVREAIAPLDRTELLTSDLALALSALHAARGPLSAALEVFAREPLLDWTREAVSVAQKAGIAAADAPAAHNARRLATARSKLAYANPVDTALRDLAPSWRSKAANWAALQALVRGDAKRGNMRAAVCDRDTSGPNGVTPFCADAREQAACLVDLATDANVLGRCWVGWRPWL